MISFSELKKGTILLLEKQPHEILEANPLFKGRGHSVLQVKLRNLITGNLINKTFHPSNSFEEAALEELPVKFLYHHRGQYFFQKSDSSERFNLNEEHIGWQKNFLKPGLTVKAVALNNEIVSISLPLKICLKVIEAPPGIRAGRAESGTKPAILESGAQLNIPLFIEEGDIIELNTETGQYVRRIEKGAKQDSA